MGLRVITYFEDDVNKIAKMIEEEFEIDRANTIDKRQLLDPDRFGYLSLHYVISLGKERGKLTEYARFQGLKAEIQIRSILQHAWAEIEHDLGYKSSLAVPQHIRRNFSQLAGLLEIADQQFVNIRNNLKFYEEKVSEEIQKSSKNIPIDLASLSVFIKKSKLVKHTDEKIASIVRATIEDEFDSEVIENDLRVLRFFGILWIDRLEEKFKELSSEVVQFARIWLSDSTYRSFRQGISLLYFYYVLIAKSGDRNMVLRFLDAANIDTTSLDGQPGIATEILATYKKIQGQ